MIAGSREAAKLVLYAFHLISAFCAAGKPRLGQSLALPMRRGDSVEPVLLPTTPSPHLPINVHHGAVFTT